MSKAQRSPLRTDEGSLHLAVAGDGLATVGVVINRSVMSGSDRFSQCPTKADTFRNASIFGIVIASIRDLKSTDGRLHRRNLCRESRLADWLSMTKPRDLYVNDVVARQLGIQHLQAAEGFIHQSLIGPSESFMTDWHVVRNVDDAIPTEFTKIGKFDDSGNLYVLLRYVNPEMLTHRSS